MANDFEALRLSLQALMTTDHQRIQRRALKAVGTFVKTEMQAKAPIKTKTARGELQPGELKESIKARVSVPTDEGIVQGRTAKVVIGPTGRRVKEIAHDVEYGHSNPSASRNGKLKETPPHPFIRPVAEATQARSLALYRASVTEDILQVMKR